MEDIKSFYILIYKIKNILKFERAFSELEISTITRWIDYFDEELILKACDITINRPNIESGDYVKYINGILRNWSNDNVKTPEETDNARTKFWEQNGPTFGFFVGELRKNKNDISREVKNSFEEYLGPKPEESIIAKQDSTLYSYSFSGKKAQLEIPNELSNDELEDLKYKLFRMIQKDMNKIPGMRLPLKDEIFENTNWDFYDYEELEEFKAIFEEAKRLSKEIISGSLSKKNSLVFTLMGESGRGKSFIANCIGNEVLSKGKGLDVANFSAYCLFDTIISYKFGKNKNVYYNVMGEICSIDLLIIDDLGTEFINRATSSCLFEILKERLYKNKPTVICTDLPPSGIYRNYGQKTFSLICEQGEVNVLPLGDNFFILKKQLNRR